MTANDERVVRISWRCASAALVLAALLSGCSGQRVVAPEPPLRLAALLSEATIRPRPASVRREHSSLRRDLRDGLTVTAPSEIRFSLEPLRWQRLSVSVGARGPRKQDPKAARKLRFAVRAFDSTGSLHAALEETIEIAAGENQGHWRELRIDLSPLLGQAVELELGASWEGPGLTAYWGNPLLHGAGRDPSRPDVILISVDTLGTRHMSLYGYERATTPELERLARDAVVFEQAVTHHSWTLTAHASLLTSLYPDTHRVSYGRALPARAPSLPRLLTENGYFAIGLVNNPYLNPSYGYGELYDRYDFDHEKRIKGARVKRTIEESHEILEALLSPGAPSPFFLFFHLIDVHSDWRELPYEVPEPFLSRFLPGDVEEVWSAWRGKRASSHLAAVNSGDATLDTGQVEQLVALYDAGVAYTDHHLGRFFETLRSHGLYEGSLIIVTSDHGEEFLEHGHAMHIQAYEEVLRVPLIVKFPNQRFAGRRVDTQVQLVDVLPTALDSLGLVRPPSLEGHSLLPVIAGEAHERGMTFAKGTNQSLTPKDIYVARSEEWKLFWWIETGRTELYHLPSDPEELHDVSDQQTDVRDEMLAALIEHRASRNEGFRLRVPAHASEQVLSIRLTADGGFSNLAPYDLNAPPRKGFFRLSEDGRELSFEIRPRQFRMRRPVGLDFELPPRASFRVEAALDGTPISNEQLLLGPDLEPASSIPAVLTRGDPVLRGKESGVVSVPHRADAPRIHLWEARAPKARRVQLRDEEKEALRALGYVAD